MKETRRQPLAEGTNNRLSLQQLEYLKVTVLRSLTIIKATPYRVATLPNVGVVILSLQLQQQQ